MVTNASCACPPRCVPLYGPPAPCTTAVHRAARVRQAAASRHPPTAAEVEPVASHGLAPACWAVNNEALVTCDSEYRLIAQPARTGKAASLSQIQQSHSSGQQAQPGQHVSHDATKYGWHDAQHRPHDHECRGAADATHGPRHVRGARPGNALSLRVTHYHACWYAYCCSCGSASLQQATDAGTCPPSVAFAGDGHADAHAHARWYASVRHGPSRTGCSPNGWATTPGRWRGRGWWWHVLQDTHVQQVSGSQLAGSVTSPAVAAVRRGTHAGAPPAPCQLMCCAHSSSSSRLTCHLHPLVCITCSFRNGTCNIPAEQCKYAHGEDDLRQPGQAGPQQGGRRGPRIMTPHGGPINPGQPQAGAAQPPNKVHKTRLCERFMNTGDCPYGARCTFAHGCVAGNALLHTRAHSCSAAVAACGESAP